MTGLIAFVAFLLAFVFNGLHVHADVWLSPVSLLYLGLVFLVLYVSGHGKGVPW